MHFKTSTAIVLATIISQALAHCVLTSITGSNGVTMPGLSVMDGTPRDCARYGYDNDLKAGTANKSSPLCGSEADTSVIRRNGSPLGKTSGGGEVDAAAAVAKFMGNGATAAARFKRNLLGSRFDNKRRALLDKLDGLLGGAAGGGGKATEAAGTKTPKGTVEDGVAKSAGTGAKSGLPTVGADGVIEMVMHQVNQDGAGPMTAAIDPTSGGTSEAAFQPAEMIVDVPGAIAGISGTTTTDFPIKVQMPAGMTCSGTVAGVENVCVVRVKNSTPAGPFGGSAVFTQEGAATGGNYTAAAKRDVRVVFDA